MKARNPSVSKVRQFLNSKHSYTKLTLAKRTCQRLKRFARFKNEGWCMDLAYVDKLSKDSNGVKCLLVRQDMFDRTVDSKRMKTKNSKETFRAFFTMITKQIRPWKFWVDKGTELAGECKKLCKAEGIQIYSTMSEAKAAFAERTIRTLKNKFQRYMENNGYKYIHELTHIVTTLFSRRNSSFDLTPKNVRKNSTLCPF